MRTLKREEVNGSRLTAIGTIWRARLGQKLPGWLVNLLKLRMPDW